MKFKAPDNLGGFSYMGEAVNISSGVVEASSPDMAEALQSHGFVPYEEPAEQPSQPAKKGK